MTLLAANQPCKFCGGVLLPVELAKHKTIFPPLADYYCDDCGHAYRWEHDGTKLVPILVIVPPTIE